MELLTSKHSLRAREQFAAVTAWLAIAVGGLVLLGWTIGNDFLKRVVPELAPMKANTAVCCILFGIALLASQDGVAPRRRHYGWWGAVGVLLIAATTLLQTALGVDFGIDQLLFDEPGAIDPGRMGVITAIVYLLLSLALLLGLARRAILLAQVSAVGALMLSAVCVASYLYARDSLQVIAPFSAVAIHTAVTLTLLSAGTLFSLLTSSQMELLVGESTGGMLNRRLLPAAVLVPLAIGWIGLMGQDSGWYGIDFNIAMVTVIRIACLIAMVLWMASNVTRLEAERERSNAALKASEEQLRRLNAGLEQQVLERTSALQQSEQRFRAIFNTQFQFIGLMNTDGILLEANAAALAAVGVSASEVIGKPMADTAWWRHDPLQRQRLQQAVKQAAEGKHVRFEASHIAGDGSTIWVDFSLTPFRDSRGEVIMLIPEGHDITQRKRAEKEMAARDVLLRNFIKHSPAAIVMTDRDLRYVQASDRWLADYNLDGRDVMGAHHYELFPDIPERWKVIHQRVLAGAVEQSMEDPFERADGSVMWLQWECRPWHRGDGTVGGIIMFTQIITKRKEAEEQVKSSLREKEVLLKEIHHRVKNNLQIVSTLLDLQSEHTNNAQALAMFQESRSRVKSMALIHERLYRSHDMAHVNFNEYVQQLVDDLYQSYKMSDDAITLQLDVNILPLSLDIAIPCGLLLNELITNCFKHAFASGHSGRIRVALHGEDADGVALTVADDGIGLPAGFDLHKATSFGMQLVVTLVEQLQGRITLDSSAGAAFTIRFKNNKK